jgi:hypothetical protein
MYVWKGVKMLKRDDYNLNSGFKCLCQFGTRLRAKRVELLSRSSSKYSGCNCQTVGYEYMLASLTNPYHYENLKFDQVQDILSHVEWGYTTYSKVNMKYFNPLAYDFITKIALSY